MNRLSQSDPSLLSAAGPVHVFALNSLLFPLLAAANFVVCAMGGGAQLTGRYYLFCAVTFLLTNLILDSARVHTPHGPRERIGDLLHIALRWALVAALTVGLMDVGGALPGLDRAMLWAWAISTPFSMWAAQMVIGALLEERRVSGGQRRNAVIVGVSDVGLSLEARLNASPILGTRVLGFFEDRSAARVPLAAHGRILGKVQDLPQYVARTGTQLVYITLPMSRQQRIVDLLNNLRDSTASIYFVPDMFVCNLIQARIDAMGGIPLIAVCESPFYGLRGMVKRLMDIFFAAGLLIVTSPLLVLAAVGIKLTSPGPVLFRQKRYGLDGQSISVYKFRSMSVVEDGDQAYRQVARGDTRVTPFGGFLRRTSIDELPQLLNVLEGSMSLVGPRPHVIAVNEQFRRLIPGYMIRHKVRPGITGWAQVNGYRGGDDLGAMTKRIEYDLEYLRCWSMSLDLLIILRTVVLVFNDRRAY